MPPEKKAPDGMYLRSLSLENVRAFGRRQSLDFVDENGAVSLWNLILGENNVGKTTLMQALAVMRPVPTNYRPSDTSPPKVSKAELSDYQNDEIARFIRRGGTRKTTMAAVFQVGGRPLPRYVAKIIGNVDGLKDAKGHVMPLGMVDGQGGQVLNQAIGCAVAWGLAIVGTLIILKVCDMLIGVRVTKDQEMDGLDVSQHGEEGYVFEA